MPGVERCDAGLIAFEQLLQQYLHHRYFLVEPQQIAAARNIGHAFAEPSPMDLRVQTVLDRSRSAMVAAATLADMIGSFAGDVLTGFTGAFALSTTNRVHSFHPGNVRVNIASPVFWRTLRLCAVWDPAAVFDAANIKGPAFDMKA